LPPFQKAIEAGVDAVMMAHVTVPALEPDPKKVASTSPAIVTGLLKRQMGFQGLVVTDALDMGGLMRLYIGAPNPSGAAAVAAVKAGNDVVLIPADVDGAFNGLLNAVRSGEIPEAQIDASVLKILRAKASVGLHKARLVDIEALNRIVAQPGNVAAGQRMADAAVTLVRDNGQVLPIKRRNQETSGPRNPYLRVQEARTRVVAVIFEDDVVRADTGRVFEQELRARAPDATVFFVDPRSAAVMAEPIVAAVDQAQVVIAPVYEVPTAGKAVRQNGELKNTVALAEPSAELMRRILQRAAARTVVVAMGNPYLAADFPEVQVYLCAFSSETVSELSAVKALFGEIAIRGRLPVTIPSIAQRGAGIERPQQVVEGGLKRHANSKTTTVP
jgi:beta-N-acetylhexosaminidase